MAFDCKLFGSLFKTLAVLCTQQRWPRVLGHTSSTACQKPSAPSATASWARSQARSLQVEEELLPGLGTLAHAVDQADQLLLALGRGADDDQQALRGLLEPGLDMDAIGPEVHAALRREIALAPAHMLFRPGVLEPPDGRGREPAGILAEQGDQRLLEVASGHASAGVARSSGGRITKSLPCV